MGRLSGLKISNKEVFESIQSGKMTYMEFLDWLQKIAKEQYQAGFEYAENWSEHD